MAPIDLTRPCVIRHLTFELEVSDKRSAIGMLESDLGVPSKLEVLNILYERNLEGTIAAGRQKVSFDVYLGQVSVPAAYQYHASSDRR